MTPTFGAQAPSQDASTSREGAEGACEASPKPTEPTPTRGHPMTTAPMGDEELSDLRENIAAMIRTDGAMGLEDQIPALLARLDAAEANARRMRDGLERIAEHPGPNADENAWWRVEIARAALKEGGE